MDIRAFRQIAYIASILLAGCATPKEAIVEPASRQSRGADSILDLPFPKIQIAGYRMRQALRIISHAIETKSEGRLHFSYGIQSSASQRAAANGHPLPVDKLIVRDPFVRISAQHETLGAILNRLCQESGWSYALTPGGYMFIDDKTFVDYRYPQ